MTKSIFEKIRAVLQLLMLLPFFTFAQVNLLQTTNNNITKVGFGCVNMLGGESSSAETNQARLYNLTALGYSKFEVTKVSFALHSFERGSATNFPVTVKVYASTGGTAQANLTLRGQEVVNITESMVGKVVGVSLAIPAMVTSPQMLIVVSAPNGDATSTSFSIGANEDGQTNPPYYQSSECGNNGPEFKSYLEMSPSRPNTHLILFPTGNPMTQCPVGDVYLTSQAQVNQFLTDYPNCTQIAGNIWIGYSGFTSDITNLSPLNNLTSIGGSLIISNNASLANVNGLSNLQTIGNYLEIENNSALQNLGGLSGLKSIAADLTIKGNAQLANLNGLSSLTSISGWLTVENNAALANISGLGNITTGMSKLVIKNNTALAACNLPNFCTYLSNPTNTHPREILGNLANCLNEAAVVVACAPKPQCPTGDVTLATQAQVDQFKIDYPNCTKISGTLILGGGTLINDLSPLSNLTNITGHLHIRNQVANLDGLDNIASIGLNLSVTYNNQLSNLNGLIGLTSIGSGLFIGPNGLLTSLDGLNNLTSMGGYININGNTLLNDISALRNTTFNPSGGQGLSIYSNPALAVCNLPNFCTYLAKPSNTHPRNITGNKDFCLNEQAVKDACEASKCPPGNVTLNTQAQVNQFLADYPNCTEITGDLVVGIDYYSGSGVSDITDLSPLANITSVGGNLYIYKNENLANIAGLNKLANIGDGMLISDNPSLTNIDGLSSLTSFSGQGILIAYNEALLNVNGLSGLTSIGGDLMFVDNSSLTNLNGLSNLTSVGRLFSIVGSSSLTNIDALSHLTSVGQLNIQDNSALTNLNGLINLTSVTYDIDISRNAVLNDISALQNITFNPIDGVGLSIYSNPVLAVCNLPNFCTYLANAAGTHPRNIFGNLANCLDEAAVSAACFSVLPVVLTTFTATADGNYIKLQWKTASEVNNKGFEIYRSGDDGKFVKIGDALSSQTYTYIDKHPLNGSNYYKLVQIDNDGKENELGVRELEFGLSTANIKLYPNPTVTNEVMVSWSSSAVNSVKLVDLNGKVLQTIQPKSTSATISLANYAAGTYLVRIESSNGVETRKVIKL